MDNQRNETYINHPTFGLLYRICLVQEHQELFTTLYAQRLFFLVTVSPNKLDFETITRSDARMLVEQKMRKLRSTNSLIEYQQLQKIYQNTFQ